MSCLDHHNWAELAWAYRQMPFRVGERNPGVVTVDSVAVCTECGAVVREFAGCHPQINAFWAIFMHWADVANVVARAVNDNAVPA